MAEIIKEPTLEPTLGSKLTVRPLGLPDVESVVRYWHDSPEADLQRMGVDVQKLASEATMRRALSAQAASGGGDDVGYCLIWEVDGIAVGFTTLKDIVPRERGGMHLHIWDASSRGRGFGAPLFCRAALEFYRLSAVAAIVCEPRTANPMPNRMLQKAGFALVRTYVGRSSALSVETELNSYAITREAAARFLAQADTACGPAASGLGCRPSLRSPS